MTGEHAKVALYGTDAVAEPCRGNCQPGSHWSGWFG